MVYRIYVQKRSGFDIAAKNLAAALHDMVGIESLTGLSMVNRYDVEGIDRELFDICKNTVFCEPQVDICSEQMPDVGDNTVFAVEFKPGQFDQRADSAAECIQLISQQKRPVVRTATLYYLQGDLSASDIDAIKRYIINPLESREATLAPKKSLHTSHETAPSVDILQGFIGLSTDDLQNLRLRLGLTMSLDDLALIQTYFKRKEKRDPTITEIRVLDTFWSDHCRHTTFHTKITDVHIEDPHVKEAFHRYQDIREKMKTSHDPVTLMDIATIGGRYLEQIGKLTHHVSDYGANASGVSCRVDVDGNDEDWRFFFKNETHNHPTEIEPFGGAATCVGGAIRDPLAERGYVYQGMRISGTANPLEPVSDTLIGKLPQRKLEIDSANGFSSYGNQVGLAAGQVSELYHPGYKAKHMELGAVVGAAPTSHVRCETPVPGDVVVLVGGRTGRDGIGGATGASKPHTAQSLTSDGAEVQMGNAPEERKLQRLFRRSDASVLVKRCNDLGAGGIAVACGEIADGIDVDLDRVPLKYTGLDGTEIALSESQERMVVVLSKDDVQKFCAIAHSENLEATSIATIGKHAWLSMSWHGQTIVHIAHSFLSSAGAERKTHVLVRDGGDYHYAWNGETFKQRFVHMLSDLNVCCKKGLSERFDSTVGAASVLMPFGGKYQLTPNLSMVAKLPVDGETTTCSGMAWGGNPYLLSSNQFEGGYEAVIQSVSKLVATGFSMDTMYLSLQEYFEKLGDDPARWGKPFAALLGALQAQLDIGVGAIGGKDSMSGSFEDLDVPPTLISFAVALGNTKHIVSPEFKCAGDSVWYITPHHGDGDEFSAKSFLAAAHLVELLISKGYVRAASIPQFGGLAQSLFEQCVGNHLGISCDPQFTQDIFTPECGAFVVEIDAEAEKDAQKEILAASSLDKQQGAYDGLCSACLVGHVSDTYTFVYRGQVLDCNYLQSVWESKLDDVMPYRKSGDAVPAITYHPYAEEQTKTVEQANATRHSEAGSSTSSQRFAKAPGVRCNQKAPVSYSGPLLGRPKVVIPVFPGTNTEFDVARAFRRAGAKTETLVITNLNHDDVIESSHRLCHAISTSQIIAIPGGFSGGDEPDGSAKLITSFFRAPHVKEAVYDLLQNRDGLMLGICNGFQALVKLGLVPYGEIRTATPDSPTLTFNTIGRHQSKLVRTRICSVKSPWMSGCTPGQIHLLAVSHGEGRFVASANTLARMQQQGQIVSQYVDEQGHPSMDLQANPNGSVWAIEGITSPDGRVLGEMCHPERSGDDVFMNVPGNTRMPLFESGVKYFMDA